jgi:hypothetical protein
LYADGNWQMCVPDHIRALTNYGLYENLASLNIGFVGNPTNIVMAQEYLALHNINYNVAATAPGGWEQVTLDPLYEMAVQDQDAYYVYAHTKGAANFAPVNEVWRNGMTRVNIVEWERAVQVLDEGYTTAGCHYYPNNFDNPNPFWGGNFWWATGKHIAMLGICENDYRHRAEAWVGKIHGDPFYKQYDLWPVGIGTVPQSF